MSSYRLPDGSVPVLLSSDHVGLLPTEAAAVLAYLVDHPRVSPDRVADMLFRTRVARRHRALAMVTSRDDLIEALRAIADDRGHPSVVRTGEPAGSRRAAYVFPGQGGQRPGMGRLFYDGVASFREEVDRCDAAFDELFGHSPSAYLLDADHPVDDSAQVVQPALFVQMAGLAAMWRSVGVAPDAVVGHSQGEIAAAYVSGAMTLADAALVVGSRAQAVDTIASDRYAMAVAATDRDECEQLLARHSGWAQVSVINSPRLVGISGDRGTVADIVDTLTANDRFARLIRVQYPAHTDRVTECRTSIDAALQGRLTHRHFLDTETPCLGATLGEVITPDLSVDEYWFWNLRNRVRFDRAVAAAVDREIDTFVELAEHPTLEMSIRENLTALRTSGRTGSDTVTATSTREAGDLSEFTRNLARVAVHDLDYRWDSLRTDGDTADMVLPDFPHTVMNEVPLWLPYRTEPGGPLAAAPVVTEPSTDPAVSAEASTMPAQLLVEQWDRLTQRSLVPPRSLGIIDHTGRCAELAAALCAHAPDQGASARVIDPAAAGEAGDADTIVVLLPSKVGTDGAAVGSTPHGSAAAEVAEFFGTRAWWSKAAAGVTDWWLVTVGGEAVVPDDPPPDPVPAAAAAGFRCLGAEYPGVTFRHLDLAADAAGPDDAPAVLTALHTAKEPELALREGVSYAKRLTEVERDPGPDAFDHVVILGGTGGVGLEFAEYTARHGARRITLVSRSGETATVADRLRSIRSGATTDIRVVQCDIGDPAAVGRLANELGAVPADLVVHAAADIAGLTNIELVDITTEQVDRALRGKVSGIDAVLNAVARSEDCRVVLCSSFVATLGGRAMSVYAASNRMLDAVAHRLRAEGCDAVSVQWGQWSVHRGAGTSDGEVLASVGYLPMAPADAVALGLRGRYENTVVAAFDWDRGRSVLGQLGYGPVLSDLRNPVPPPVASGRRDDAPAVVGSDVPQRLLLILADVMGADDVDTIDTARPLVAVGLDSLQALGLRRQIEQEFDVDVPVADLIGGLSLDDVMGMLTGTASPDSASPKPLPAGTADAPVVSPRSEAAAPADPDALDGARIRSARRDMDLFGLRAMMGVLGPVLSSGAFRSVDEIADALEFAPRHRWLLRQWLLALAENDCLEGDPGRGYRYRTAVAAPQRADLFEVCADLGYPGEFATFLARTDEHLADMARDTVRVQEFLFPDGDMVTADTFYRDNVGSRYLNRAARDAVADLVARRRHDRSPVRILELGAGVGGMTSEVVEGLSGMPVEYHFSDVSAFFLTAARKRFADVAGMRFGIVDMNADLPQQPRCDIVLASNVVHNARHIGDTLRQLHDLLNPGGAVVFLEFCRAHCEMLTSVHFLMSAPAGEPTPGHDDVRAGTDRIFLTQREWRDQLTDAGLTLQPVLPAADHPLSLLDQHLFVAVREDRPLA